MAAYNPFLAQQQNIQRQQSLAQALNSMALQPQQTQVISGYAVPSGFMGGLTRIAQALAAKHLTQQADNNTQNLLTNQQEYYKNLADRLAPPGVPKDVAETAAIANPNGFVADVMRHYSPTRSTFGNTPIYYKTPDGKVHIGRMTPEGMSDITPEGATPLPGTIIMANQGTQLTPVNNKTGEISTPLPVNVSPNTAAAQAGANERQQKQPEIAAESTREKLQQTVAQNLPTMDNNINHMLDVIDQIGKSPGLPNAVGRYHEINPLSYGQDAANTRALLEQLKGQLFTNVMQSMRGAGLGALSDAEGAKIQNAIGALDPYQSVDQFKSQLQKIRQYMVDMRSAIHQQAGQKPQATTQNPSHDPLGILQ